ncbi:MAG: hypothetical protein ABDH37_04955 [Candidatus Hydrothermales bacterium]
MNLFILIFFSYFKINLNSYFYPYALDEGVRYYPLYSYLDFSLENVYLKGLFFNFSANYFQQRENSEYKIFCSHLGYKYKKFCIKLGRQFLYEGVGSFLDGISINFSFLNMEPSFYLGKRAFLPFKAKNLFFRENQIIYGLFYKISYKNFSLSFFLDNKETFLLFRFNKLFNPHFSLCYDINFKNIKNMDFSLSFKSRLILVNLRYFYENSLLSYLKNLNEILESKVFHKFIFSFNFKNFKIFTPTFYYRLSFSKNLEKSSDFILLNLRKGFFSFRFGYGGDEVRTLFIYHLDVLYPYKNFLFNFSFKTYDDSNFEYYLNSLIFGFSYKVRLIKFISELRFFSNPFYERDIRGFFGVELNYKNNS